MLAGVRCSRNRVQFLCLHHVFTDEVEPFRRLLRALAQDHRFIGYAEAVSRVWTGNIDRPYVCLSFDDGLKSCLTAARVMEEFGARACFFVCPAIVGEARPKVIAAFCQERLEMPPAKFLSWNEIDALLRAGHEIGGHTMSHANLAVATPDQVTSETAECFNQLAHRIGRDNVRHFAWPYGRLHHFSPSAARAVFEAGFVSCASVEFGAHVARASRRADLCIHRTTVFAGRPAERTLALLARHSQKATASNNNWPAGWSHAVQGGSA